MGSIVDFSFAQPLVAFKPAQIKFAPKSDSDGIIRSLPELIEYNARVNPNHVFCVQARKRKEDGSATTDFLAVTHIQLRQAIANCSKWLRHNIRELSLPQTDTNGVIQKGPPIALLMESDVGILFHLFSCMSLGVPVVLLSARLSSTAIAHLVDEIQAAAIIASSALTRVASEALTLLLEKGNKPPSIYFPRPYDAILNDDVADNLDQFLEPSHYIDEWDRNVIVLHSSGTTGLPKPIYTSHEYWLGYATCHSFNDADEAAGLSTTTLPLYHGFGLHSPALSLSMGHSMVIPPPSTIPNGSSTVELLALSQARYLMTVPMILEEIALLPGDIGLETLRSLKYVAFGGGPLKPSIGEKLAEAGVRLLKVYGMTETGPIGTIFNPDLENDWNYFTIRQDMDLKLHPVQSTQTENQIYKLVALPPGWKEPFEVQDKLVANPKNPLYEFNPVGRTDDLIILNTGEKVLPAILEGILSESSLIKSVVAFGDGRFELGVIVEPVTNLPLEEQNDFKSQIWPIVIEAGKRMDNHARIYSKDAIIIVPHDKSIPRSDKGSILRRDTVNLFEAEIEEVYRMLEFPLTKMDLPRLNMNDLESGIKNLIQTHLPCKWLETAWDYDDDLFELGMDSLQATRLRRLLLSSFQESDSTVIDKITGDFVYRNSSISSMAKYLRSGFGDSLTPTLESYVKRYSTRTPGIPSQAVVLLTGGTGSLGSHLLYVLSSLPNVAEIICLNRPHHLDALKRQEDAVASKGLQMSKEAWGKIHVVQTRTSSPLLGLESSEYRHLVGKVTHILHNAWTMDFKRTLASFESQFQTLQNLCNFALDANAMQPSIKPRILFVSSIAVVGKYGLIHNTREVPEVAVKDEACTNEFGYGQAKLVCERILETMSNNYRGQIETGYVRVGQIAGSTTNGFWNTNEHFPALVKSSQLIGKFPNIDGTFSWLPVDLAAESTCQLLLSPGSYEQCMVFHLENPIRQPAGDILATITSKLGNINSPAVPLAEWISLVCSHRDMGYNSTKNEDESGSSLNPAKNLAEFFRDDFQRMGDVVMETSQTRKLSPRLASMEQVDQNSIEKYVDYWRQVGFLE